MVNIDIRLTLPDAMAHEAAGYGLLTPESLQRLIDAEVIRQRLVAQLFTTMDSLAALDIPALSDDDVDAEIHAVRAERNRRRARRA